MNAPFPVPLSEQEARAWIASNGSRPVRELAQLWGWSASRVFRFLKRETPETRETETPAPVTSPAPGPGDCFDWCDVDKVTLAGSPMLAVYEGAQGHIVIRAAGSWLEDDAVILINPHDLPQVIHKLTRLYREWRGNQNEENEP